MMLDPTISIEEKRGDRCAVSDIFFDQETAKVSNQRIVTIRIGDRETMVPIDMMIATFVALDHKHRDRETWPA